jgi:branched-chain amino acid transport system ATP-binding protein
MEALKVEGLSKNFGALLALHNICFTIETGERVALIGPNGAGKTTLFNLLSGHLSVKRGRIYFLGRDITNMATHRRIHLGLGRSFQLTNIFLNLTVLDNILLALQGTQASRFQMFRPIRTDERLSPKAENLLGSIDLWEKRDNIVKEIGYGEQRKLEIALSLASEPKLLLLDEPSSGLTATESAGLADMLRNLGRDTTVLVVAHDMDLVFGLAERIIVLHYGEIITEGTPEEIQADPRVKEIYMGIEQGSGNA